MKKIYNLYLVLIFVVIHSTTAQTDSELNKKITNMNEIVDYATELCYQLHKNPELSLHEFETAKRMADELHQLGFEVTEHVGGNNVVGVLTNGDGPTILIRTDMDALPIKEKTAFAFASTKNVIEKDKEVPTMHACGHDIHMSTWVGTAQSLVAHKAEWNGTLILLAQEAEEIGVGAQSALDNGLYSKFPTPDYVLAYHVRPDLVSGTVAVQPGAIFAGVKTCEITVYGVGGHGAYPHKCIDPIVMSARIINDLQTIVSREVDTQEAAVITVGSIHGGTRPNIIPDEVKMELTLRYYNDAVIDQVVNAIERITKHVALSSGMPEHKLPKVKILAAQVPPLINDDALAIQLQTTTANLIGADHVVKTKPVMAAEDFSRFGYTSEDVPICLMELGMTSQTLMDSLRHRGERPYPLHSPHFCPDYPKTIATGISVMTKNVIELMNK